MSFHGSTNGEHTEADRGFGGPANQLCCGNRAEASKIGTDTKHFVEEDPTNAL
jgi:hypothetical protein